MPLPVVDTIGLMFFPHKYFFHIIIQIVKMTKDRVNWSKFCAETGDKHSLYELSKAYPNCGALNPTLSASQEMIEILDDSPPKSKGLSIQTSKGHDRSAVQFQSYNRKPQAEIVRQTSMQKARNINQPETKLTETLQITLHFWLRTYKVVAQNNFSIEKQVSCFTLERTTLHLKDDRIESLDDFVRNTLLKEVIRWEKMTNTTDDRLYLAAEVSIKEVPSDFHAALMRFIRSKSF